MSPDSAGEPQLSDPYRVRNEGGKQRSRMRVASRGDLVALIETERPTVPPAEAFALLNHLALRTTGLPLRDLLNRPAKATTPRKRKRRSS
jgi:hypothetical protein